MTNVVQKSGEVGRRIALVTALVLAAAIIVLAWFTTTTSRSDSLLLLRDQGATFTEALANSAEGALESESFFDYLVHRRFNELVVSILSEDLLNDVHALNQFALDHSLFSISVLDRDSSLSVDINLSGERIGLPQFVIDEALAMWQNTENNYIVFYDAGSGPAGAVHYYLQLTNDLQHVIVLSADAGYFRDALNETQIDQLVQKMSREMGVDYIVYQTDDGVVFSSRKVGSLSDIKSDSFLTAALNADSITSRVLDYPDGDVLELVRPFSTPDYQFGLFRVGLSLDRYERVSKRFDLLIVAASSVFVILLVVLLLYLSSRTQRHQISKELAQVKSISETIFDQMLSGVAVLDEQLRFVMSNRAFQQITGTSPKLDSSAEQSQLPPPLVEALTRKGGKDSYEVSFDASDGLRTLLVSTAEIQLGAARGAIVILSDISQLKAFERAAARKERLSELGDLAAGVAHEIRNPLNTISIAVQRLGGEFKPRENQQEYSEFVKQIRGETERLNQIITRFLALARENSPTKPDEIDLTAFLKGMVGFIRPEAESLAIDLDIQIQKELRLAIAEDRLKQVMTNLFNNAKEALAGEPGAVSITAGMKDKRLSIAVGDSGPGIPETDRERVMAPYFTTKEGGTGLGLPTVHRIISESGGEVKIGESDLGGAEISILFDFG